MLKIAVITPVHNAEEFLTDCINSVQASITWDKFAVDHFLVDDCSTDRSWGVLEGFDQVKKFRFEVNRGQSAARNFAIKQTDADYIFCLDADDVLLQNSLLRLFETAQTNKREWVYGDFLHVDKNLGYLIGQDYYGWNFKSPAEVLRSMYAGEHFFQQNCLLERRSVLEVGGYDENMRMAEDMDLFTRLLLANKAPLYLPGSLYLHRFHENNLSKAHLTDKSLHERDVATLRQKYQLEITKFLA